MSAADPGLALQQQALEECSLIASALSAAVARAPHASIHAARKAIRRLRALLGLLEGTALALDETDQRLQRLGDSLSDLRDAHVVVQAAALLQDRHAGEAWPTIIDGLTRRRDRLLQQALQRDPGFRRRLRSVAQVQAGLSAQSWRQVRRSTLRANLERSHRRVRKAARRAEVGGNAEALHRWRRRVRRLRMQVELGHGLHLHLHAAALQTGKHDARELHRLSDALGEQQDLRLLHNLVKAMPAAAGKDVVLAQVRQVATAWSA
ncbi:TPA: CHAD domain-containing protein [Stenotrophomonas maltophilia]|nr:CHAD domain-containing protein [Stenotrophomonas maltophilia]HDS1041259.1 CHAD domain-containing protein [Stenotrophomonas maltophilia]HDS1041535.1 CHAD domain-containing protein [Stenotrophomonas maltophilia]